MSTVINARPTGQVPRPNWRTTLRRLIPADVVNFLLVGAVGYAVDIAAFNVLWGTPPFDAWDPSIAKITAVALAMVVTYAGNAIFTWPEHGRTSLRPILLFVVFNLVGLSFSLVALWISHDLLGLTSRLDDNISANVIGLALGTVVRYVTYRRFVFGKGQTTSEEVHTSTASFSSSAGAEAGTFGPGDLPGRQTR